MENRKKYKKETQQITMLPCKTSLRIRNEVLNNFYVLVKVAITVTSLSLFVVSRNSINARRLENMKARERMRRSNEGEYPDSYRKL
ncbi:hypothetical protein MSG28_015565 [Choristoneura fumiferana]|uniref:Uncharacterized protein n=1 Tax=Choristoneura fumiferana TaxID=7141 RepID=A0ACC0KB64_CHOFU|nr:hypothetical protein MSG28_015565 [Choristoneura fumiferana]